MVNTLEQQTQQAMGLQPVPVKPNLAQQSADLLDKEIQEAKDSGISQDRFRPTVADVANTIVDFTPILGDIKGGVEGAEVIFDELKKDDPSFVFIGIVGGAAVLGLIPAIGDAAQKLIMKGANKFKKDKLVPEVMEELSVDEKNLVEELTKNTKYTPTTEGELYADRIATMLREGRGSNITDDMLEEAGKYDDFHKSLTQEYIDGNVGMDLPMDWESTMARAADQGLTETRYHGSNYKGLPYFRGEGKRRGAGMFNSDNVFKAFTYEGRNGETYSLLMRPLPKDAPEVDVKGASWMNLDKPPPKYELDARGYQGKQIGPNPESGPVLQGSSTARKEQRLGEFLPEQTGNLTTDSFMKKASELGYPGATVKNVEDVGASTPAGLSRDEAATVRALSRKPSETQARTDTTGIRSVGARFDPRLTGLKNINMAEGGLTSMDEQMEMAMSGEAETVDPISGNDVPPGSLPEEVRDDIDAKLSEGEYVVPADVVRFFGVKYFEDLRMEAKMGLQQMDADGRIGGEPVPAEQPQGQEDSMDVAQLKAALSESGMYAGGLTDGNSLDAFIDDASRSPMVNGRMRANGATVKMAVGGLATGNFGDVTKVDGIIKELMTAANNNPTLMDKLASKGIMVNKTGANQTPKQMEQSNKPNSSKEPVLEAAEGTLVDSKLSPAASNPFAFGGYDTLGGALFKAGGIENPQETLEKTFFNKEGKLEQIVLIGPNGEEIPVAWNTAMPIPEGYTRKATNDYGVKPAASTGEPVAIPTQSPRKTGDEAGPDPVATTNSGTGFNIGSPEDYSNATIDELRGHLKTSKNMAMAGRVATVALGPIGMLIGIAAKANQAIVERRIENELRSRAEKLKTDDILEIQGIDNKALKLEGANSKEGLTKLLGELKISRALETDEKMISKRGDNIRDTKRGLFSTIADAIFDPMARRRDDRVAASRIQDGADSSASSYSSTGSSPILRPKLRPEPTATEKADNQKKATEKLTAKQQREEEFEYKIEVSLLEIYNEEIKDLLMDSKKAMKTKLEVKRDPKKGQYVPGLTMVECHSHQDVLAIMKHGYQNRSVHGTDMNAHSSRSHCALSVYVTAQSIIDGKTTRGKLHLIDLAGSERLSKSKAEGDRKKEAQAINKSLSALGDVISARMKKQKHIPFRNSTLTYLLQDSLSNNSKTLMIVQASPVDYNLSETQATLTWGQRARSVELGKAKKNK